MVTPEVIAVDEGVLTLSVACFSCGKRVEFQVSAAGYERRMNGEHIQNCFPTLDPALRELMVSGTCPKCWDDMFGAGDDEA